MTTRLNHIIAIEKGVKAQSYSKLTELNKIAQKAELFNGFTKNYERKDEDGETLPSEKKIVQYTTQALLEEGRQTLSDIIQITARKDYTNCVANADVVLDGQVLVEDAPVSFLLFLEKTFTDYRTFIGNLPILDDAESWKMDSEAGLYKTEPTKTHRTKKLQKPIVLYDATDKHPAQTQLITEDILVGYWNQIKTSGAIPKSAKASLLSKIDVLLRAIKEARETANMQEEVTVSDISSRIFDYLK